MIDFTVHNCMISSIQQIDHFHRKKKNSSKRLIIVSSFCYMASSCSFSWAVCLEAKTWGVPRWSRPLFPPPGLALRVAWPIPNITAILLFWHWWPPPCLFRLVTWSSSYWCYLSRWPLVLLTSTAGGTSLTVTTRPASRTTGESQRKTMNFAVSDDIMILIFIFRWYSLHDMKWLVWSYF